MRTTVTPLSAWRCRNRFVTRRWLSERYPLINQPVEDATLLPEVDNLYLDLNGEGAGRCGSARACAASRCHAPPRIAVATGTIHNATHGDGVSKKLSEKDVMLSIMTAIDTQMKLVKPRQLLFIAVDGVAPRAKMNQQRSRRFRAARDLAEAHKEAVAKGEEIDASEVFDSNCITPGTEFMAAISAHLRYFVRRKMTEDPVWQRVRVIFSGHEVRSHCARTSLRHRRERSRAPRHPRIIAGPRRGRAQDRGVHPQGEDGPRLRPQHTPLHVR